MDDIVGLVSVRNFNYGSILQAFAFQSVLFRKGINNEIILYKKRDGVKQLLRVFNMPLLKAKINTLKRSIYAKLDKDVNSVMRARHSSFSEFVKKKLVFSEDYDGRKSLLEGTKKYRAFILGSDQVWNPMNLGSDFYTLLFCPKNKLKVTYASSFGVSQIPNYQIRRTKNYLKAIDQISVREDSGAQIVKRLIGKDVPVVVDPTLLLDAEDWNSLIIDHRECEDKYIFAYFVGASPGHRDAVKRLSKNTGLKVIGIPFVDELAKSDYFMVDKEYLKVGPSEFVNLIRHAEFICTDSFHATVFSIQYQKLFFVFDRYKVDDKASMNSRLFSILRKLGLESRLVSQSGDILNWYEEDIDFAPVLNKLKNLRIDSEVYLDKVCNMLKEPNHINAAGED